jgi:hypothetical protein
VVETPERLRINPHALSHLPVPHEIRGLKSREELASGHAVRNYEALGE